VYHVVFKNICMHSRMYVRIQEYIYICTFLNVPVHAFKNVSRTRSVYAFKNSYMYRMAKMHTMPQVPGHGFLAEQSQDGEDGRMAKMHRILRQKSKIFSKVSSPPK